MKSNWRQLVGCVGVFTWLVCSVAMANPEERARQLVEQMTLDEKIDLLGGTGFGTKTNARLGIPEVKMTDGPVGVRWGPATSFPSGVSMAATFNRALVKEVAEAMALETRAKGRDLLLGPCVGLARVPFGGRNFEAFGEDPFLSSEMTGWYVRGLHTHGVMGSVKHFALNDQEYKRHTIDSVIEERAFRELHLPPFIRALEEGVSSVMAAYNKVNGLYASENYDLLQKLLKDELGFAGFVVSDWHATHSVVPAALAGLDLEMPYGEFFGERLTQAVRDGQVPESLINEKVVRLLREMFRFGLFDGADGLRPPPDVVNSPQHQALALSAAIESHVLLKNEGGFLPWQSREIKRVAVIGPNGSSLRTGGGGSSLVDPFYSISIESGLKSRLGGGVEVISATGVDLPDFEGFTDPEFVGSNLLFKTNPNGFRTVWGQVSRVLNPLFDLSRPNWDMNPYGRVVQRIETTPEALLEEAVELASSSDFVVLAIGYAQWIESEGIDRASFSLPPGQEELIHRVVAANPRTVVVINSGGAVEMQSWVEKVPAVFFAWYPGQEGGAAVADLILGNVSPSAKLPVSFPKRWEDYPAYGTYPEVRDQVPYHEGIYLGYRHHDTFGVDPVFPFGHGLTYGHFEMNSVQAQIVDPRADSPVVEVEAVIENVSARTASDVVQLYVHEEQPSVERPYQELKGFEKVFLAGGERTVVRFTLNKSSFSYYSVENGGWRVNPGAFQVRLGFSSRDIRLTSSVRLR